MNRGSQWHAFATFKVNSSVLAKQKRIIWASDPADFPAAHESGVQDRQQPRRCSPQRPYDLPDLALPTPDLHPMRQQASIMGRWRGLFMAGFFVPGGLSSSSPHTIRRRISLHGGDFCFDPLISLSGDYS